MLEVPVRSVDAGRSRRGVHRAPLPEDPPTAAELEAVLARLGLEPWDITRTAEPVAKELGLKTWGRTPEDRPKWIDALAGHPKLIQRPIITADDGTTVVARDPETVRSVIS